MSKCRIDGCNQSKELSPDGYCAICVRAAADQRAEGTSNNSDPRPAHTLPGALDFSKFDQMAQQLNSGDAIDQTELLKGVFSMVYNVAKSVGVIDQVQSDIRSNTNRIEAIENRLGSHDEVPLHLGLVILNLPLPPTGVSELEYTRAIIKEVNAPGVNYQTDVVKAVRLGYKAESSEGAGDGKLGKVEVEISNTEAKASIMKTKRVLDKHQNEILRKLRIFNKKTQEQQNQDYTNRQFLKMIPGGDAWYIAGNGQLKPQQTRFPYQGNYYQPPVNQFQSQYSRAPPSQPRLQVPQPGSRYHHLQQYQGQGYHHNESNAHPQIYQQQGPQYQFFHSNTQLEHHQGQGVPVPQQPPTAPPNQALGPIRAPPPPTSSQCGPQFSFTNPPGPGINLAQQCQPPVVHHEQHMAHSGGHGQGEE